MNDNNKKKHFHFKYLQNPFYRVHVGIKLSVKWLNNIELSSFIAIIILGSALVLIPITFSYFTQNITIKNSGKILTTKTLITQKSEIRGVFFHEIIYGVSHDWDGIAETLSQYGINAVFVNDQGGFGRRSDNEIRSAIDAFHAHGIEYHSCISVLQESKPESSLGTEAIMHDGSIYSPYSHCPIKAHDYIIDNIRDYLETFPDVDGIMLDYIRYAEGTTDMCYCEHCQATFEEWLGEGQIIDWTPFYPGGARHNEFLEWRTIPITHLVRDIHAMVKSINPNIVISEAAWTLFQDCPIYWRKYLGQDTAKWIAEGYIDFVAPMMYTSDLSELEDEIDANIKYWMGEIPEGPIPLVAFLDISRKNTPDSTKQQVELCRSKGLRGWIFWRYGGPGVDSDDPDIRDYLSIIDMPSTFSLNNIKIRIINQTTTTVTWTTDLPATTMVEYNVTPLFNASWEVWNSFHYWDITYTQGIIIEDETNTTIHSITLNNLMPGTKYYIRIQSKGVPGTATSRVFTFSTPST